MVILAGCNAAPTGTPTATAPVEPTPTPELAQPPVRIVSPPDPADVVTAYFDAWQEDDYGAMYARLSAESRASISEEDFANRYLDALIEAAVPTGQLDYQILSAQVHDPESAEAQYRLVLHSQLIGDIVREHRIALALEGGEWRVIWDPALILPDLAGGNHLRMVNFVPQRGLIYDRNGDPLVEYTDAYALGLVPNEINVDAEADMLTLLSRATGHPPEYIASLYLNVGLGYEFYIPFTSIMAAAFDPFYNALNSFDAVRIAPFSGRYYVNAGVAPQSVGYVSAIQPEEVDQFRRQGYQWTERVGREGLEVWGASYLGGTRGGALYLDDPDGNLIVKIGEQPARPASDIHTTLDKDLQIAVQKALLGFKGAAVVLERDTGRVLAIASSPTFDPNLFNPDNYNSQFTSPLFNPDEPLFNRAVRGQYALGSVFKIVTIAAALESDLFSPQSTYDCQYEFTELGSPILYDWTYEREDVPPSGVLTLPEGLMRSCNPWFWHIGLTFFEQDMITQIADMAKGFGLGSPTGIELPEEAAGQVPVPTEKLDATNLAIGQGGLLVTPIQVARFVVAVGNGGTLYQPQLVERIVDSDGQVVESFQPIATGSLPVSAEMLQVIRAAMESVVIDSRGTAYRVMGAFPRVRGVPLAGKTGTAQLDGAADPHSWYVVYSDAGRQDRPDIAIAVIVENEGEGAEFAAPIALRILETYFLDRPITKFPWEARIGVPQDLLPDPEEQEEGF